MTADPGRVARRLRTEAERANQRRLLVFAGDRERTYEAAREALAGLAADPGSATLVSERDPLDCERLPHSRAGELLGTTRSVVVLDCQDRLDPNALGRVVGAVDGGGLLVVLAPSLSAWPDRTDGFDETLAVAPHTAEEVGGRFRRRLVETLRSHPGVAIVDVDEGVVDRDGLTDPPPRTAAGPVERPPEASVFPVAAYEACLTADQADAVAAQESLAAGAVNGPDDPDSHGVRGARDDRTGDHGGSGASDSHPGPAAVVLEADRGRGKSSAAGIAAGALAADGEDVLVTAPEFRSAREVFARAREVVATLGEGPDGSTEAHDTGDGEEARKGDEKAEDGRRVETSAGGRVRFLPPAEAVAAATEADVLIVDEAAALPVRVLTGTLTADRVVYATTVHGYEGTGRGFSVRFRDRLAESDHDVTDVRLDEPIRFARDDPVESWAFRALLLDARPPVDQLVTDATPDAVEYRAIGSEELLDDEHLLREVFGLLVLAHYRTEPDDLARLLDAPNVSVRALLFDGHVVSVALLAREGGLPDDLREETYGGARIRGHMIPDVLVSQLRDESAGVPTGQRVMRIATHHAVRSRGLGSRLLAEIRREFQGEVDWLGTGFGATRELLEFWAANGYRTVHLSVTRNDRSGERSAIMLSPTSEAGRDLTDRHARWFLDRATAILSGPLGDADPDVVRAALATTGIGVDPELADRGWRLVAGAAYGPGLFAVNPGPFRSLVVAHLADPADSGTLSDREERLLVLTTLQGRDVDAVTADLGYHSSGQCLRAVGDALASLVDLYGGPIAEEERRRHE